jgi:hypothetical protein
MKETIWSKNFIPPLLAITIMFFGFLKQASAQAFTSTLLQTNQAHLVQVNEIYGRLPLSFEANEGQADAQVKFLSRGKGYTLFLSSTEAVLALGGKTDEPPGVRKQSAIIEERVSKAHSLALKMQLVGCNPNSRITGLDKLPGKSNYFIGKDPKKWRINISHFAKVRYEEVYPGVDLVFYGNQNQFEYDFIVAPGAKPEAITLAFEGADNVEIDNQGNVVLHTESGEVVNHIPLVYQEVDGVKQSIAGRYVLKGRNLIEFQIDAYDSDRTVVIDPVLSYSTYLGGTASDSGQGIDVDSAGNVYVTGSTSSTNFPTSEGAFQTAGVGGDAFVAKFNPTGSALVYSTYIGGDNGDAAYDISVDGEGNALLTGNTSSTDFPTKNAYQSSLNGGGDAGDVFVLKLNSEGTALMYSTYLGGQGLDSGLGIGTDPSGNIYVTGNTFSSDFPTTPGVLIPDSNSGAFVEAFVTKVNPAKSGQESLVYSTYLTNVTLGLMGYSVYGKGIVADRFGNAYVTGSTDSWYFPTSPDAFQTTIGSAITTDAFVTKMSSDGTFFWYSTYLGGNGNDEGRGISVDSSGNAYVTGLTYSTNFPTKNPLQSSNQGVTDVFITKLNPSGSALIYSTYLGGGDFDIGYGVAVDPTGNAHLTGSTSSDDFPVVNSFQSNFGGGLRDAFATKVSSDGSKLLYSTYLGGSGDDDIGDAMATDPAGNVYVTGITTSADFLTVNPFQNTLKGTVDAFVVKIKTSTAMPWIPLLLGD